MTKLVFAAAALLGFAASGVAAPARAGEIQVTVSGNLQQGFDTPGLFGSPYSMYSGNAYVMRFLIDTSYFRGFLDSSGASRVYVANYGSPQRPDGSIGPGPVSNATLTINGQSLAMEFPYLFASTDSDALTGGMATYQLAGGGIWGGSGAPTFLRAQFNFNLSGPAGIFPSLATDFSVNAADITGGFGGYGLDFLVYQLADPYDNLALGVFSGVGPVTSITSFAVDAPEPASLALVCVGLAGIGVVRRRRRS